MVPTGTTQASTSDGIAESAVGANMLAPRPAFGPGSGSGSHLRTGTAKPNQQLYEESKLRELFAERGPVEPGETFFNQRTPNLGVLHEKVEHRLILLCKLRGMSNREIAMESGYSEPWISQLLRQPWAVAMMARLTTETGVEAIQKILESEAVPSIMRLVELRDDPEVPATVARSACDSLLDRYLGKPTQHVDVVQTSGQATAETIAEVDKELEALKAEEKNLMGHN